MTLDFPVSSVLFGLGNFFLRLVLILIIAYLALRLARLMVDRFFRQGNKMFANTEESRLTTLRTIMSSMLRYVIIFITGVMILELLGLDTASLIAAAGIGGLAIGFGAQNLVRDVVTGFFVLLEDHFDVGDFVTIGDVSGLVEEMGIRITKIRDFGGELHILPNGEIKKVTNHMGSSMRVLVEVDIAYEVDVDKAVAVLETLFAELTEEITEIVEGPKVLGVQALGDSGVKLMTMARTIPMSQWSVGRQIRKRIKEAFDENGIEIPYPRRYLVFDKKSTPRPEENPVTFEGSNS